MRYVILLIVFYAPVSFGSDYTQEIIDHALYPCLKVRFAGNITPDLYERPEFREPLNQMNKALNMASLTFETRKEIYEVIKTNCANGFSGDSYKIQREIDSIVTANTKSYKPVLISLFILVPVGIWAYIDARKRKNNFILWPIFIVLIGIFALPVYLAKRNLKEGEMREGGVAWNTIKYFAMIWTIFMLIVAIVAIYIVLPTHTMSMGPIQSLITTILGISMYGFIWLGVMISAFIIGLFLKKNSDIEKGPTGALKVTM